MVTGFVVPRWLACRAVFHLLFLAAIVPGASQVAEAHGSMLVPESRSHYCRFSGDLANHSDPACRAAIDVGGTRPLVEWNGVRQGSARGQHRDLIPDGELCSAGKPAYRGLDLVRDDWQTTPIASADNGSFDFLFHVTALHRTTEWLFFVTPEGFDPNTPFGWDDLEPFCRSGEVPVERLEDKNVYRIPCVLPPRTGRQVIYSIWQADSGEAFYSCSDVNFIGSGTTPDFEQLGKLEAAERLPAGTTLTFRVLRPDGSDEEMVPMVVGLNRDSPESWSLDLADQVNTQSQVARIGVLNSDGQIVPVVPPAQNLVYGLAGRDFSFAVETRMPECADLIDNDGDGAIDLDDENCFAGSNLPEGPLLEGCGRGFETALVLPGAWALRRRTRRFRSRDPK